MVVTCGDGKYTWEFDETSGKLTCLRNGEKWRDETGDGAILALLQHASDLQEKIQMAKGCLVCAGIGDPMEVCVNTLSILEHEGE